MRKLPAGWKWLTLGDVAKWSSGGTPKAGNSSYYDGNIPWAIIGDLSDGPLLKTQNTITELGLSNSSAKIVPPGTLLIAMYGSIGKLGWTVHHASTNQAIATAVPGPNMELKYLFYFLLSQRRNLATAGKGATQKNISQTILKKWPIPVPPLDDQRRIIEFLESHLPRLESASSNLANQAKRLNHLRAASILRMTQTEDSTPVTIRDLLIFSIGGVWGKDPGRDEVDVRVWRVTEMKDHGELDPSTAALRSISHKQLASRKIQSGDLLLEKSGGGPNTPVGRVGLIRNVTGDAVCANFMQLMRPDTDKVLPRFLHLVLNSIHETGGTIRFQVASTNIRNIKASDYLSIPAHIPPLNTQRAILEVLEATLESIGALDFQIRMAQSRMAILRQSILTAAIEGRLTKSQPSFKIHDDLTLIPEESLV